MYEDLSVSNPSCQCGLLNGFYGFIHIRVSHHNFYFNLWQKIDDVFSSSVQFGMPLLSSKTLYFTDRHSLDSRSAKAFFNFFQFERFYNGFNFFHVSVIGVKVEQTEVSKIIEGFSSYLKAEKVTADGTVHLYKKIVVRFLSFCTAHSSQLVLPDNWELSDLRLRDLEAFLIDDAVHHGTQHETRVTYLSGIRSFFRYLYELGTLTINPIQHFTLPRGFPEMKRVEDPQERLQQLFEKLNSWVYSEILSRLLLELAYGHGMSAARLAEIKDVQKFDTVSVKIIFMNEDEKIFPSAESFQQILEKYLLLRDEIRGKVKVKTESFWFDKKGKIMKAGSINRLVNRTLSDNGLGDYNLWSMRELSTQQFADGGADIRSLQKMRRVRGLRRLKTLYRKDFDELQDTFTEVHLRNQDVQ